MFFYLCTQNSDSQSCLIDTKVKEHLWLCIISASQYLFQNLFTNLILASDNLLLNFFSMLQVANIQAILMESLQDINSFQIVPTNRQSRQIFLLLINLSAFLYSIIFPYITYCLLYHLNYSES